MNCMIYSGSDVPIWRRIDAQSAIYTRSHECVAIYVVIMRQIGLLNNGQWTMGHGW